MLAVTRTLLFFIACYHHPIHAQNFPADANELVYGRAIKCKRDDGTSQRCMPVFENVAFGRRISANNTCGLDGPSQYCVQTGTSGAKKICNQCDADISGLAHPAHLMTDTKIDNNPTWWQSETLHRNKHSVVLKLDFKKKYNIAFVRIRFHTIRPHSFSIYKKSTYDSAEKWLPYQFYSRTCEKTYGLPDKGTVSINNQKIALCTDKASGMIPLSGGNVAYSTLDHRPGKKYFDRYPELQQWVTVTQLQFNLDRLNTFGDEVFGDHKVLKSYYFAISDIAVGGRCKCNGHGSTCARNDIGGYYCECDHNTAGKDCQKCLPLFNDRPWRRASGLLANPCKECNCNGLADECEFDEQLWIDSNYRSGGRCKNCQLNTEGINCDRCKVYHYRQANSQYCAPCNCNQVGSRTSSCNSAGVCTCKPGVTGEKCDQCKPGYYGFSHSGCRQCNCDKEGSISSNCDATGQCQCKENVVGKNCNQCAANHFDLDSNNPKGCKACFCYGHGVSCTAAEGTGIKEITSTFDTDHDGWRLEDAYGNSYNDNMQWDSTVQYIYINPAENRELYFIAPYRYLGNKLSSYGKNFKFTYGIFRHMGDPEIITRRDDIMLEGAGMTASYEVTSQNNERPKARFVTFEYKLVEPEGMSTFNFQKLLSDLTAIKIRVSFLKDRRAAIDAISMESTQFISTNSPDQITWQEKCECENGYTGQQCEKCDSGYTRETVGSGPLGRCVPCECNNHGKTCDPETGVCDCIENTAGRNCEICKEGFYGNPTKGNPDDCQPCPCIFGNKCIQLGDRVKCTDCPDGHSGDRCQNCSDGYFGDPEGKLGIPTRCQLCDCNGNVDPSVPGNCDGVTGACLRCINNTKNGRDNKCELCDDGYFGDALLDPKGNCTPCECYAPGSKKPVGYQTGDPIPCDKDGKCLCLDIVLGEKCDECPAGHWNVKSGEGCEKCNCDKDGSLGGDCDVETGQCKCKPGVAGRTCDQCDAGHYDFSPQGCQACKCHPDGSKSENCTQDGVCDCKPGVLGIKCDQCPENKFNLSVGCIACPRCFDLVQIAVNKLRKKLAAFNFTNLTNSTNPGGINIQDINFAEAVRALDKEIQELKKKTEDLLDGDKDLLKYFEDLSGQLERLMERYEVLNKTVEKSAGAAKNGQTVITKAEEIIEEIKKLLEYAEDKIRNSKIFKANTDDVSDVAKQMKEIAEEARQLADKHVRNASYVKMTTDMAYNTSLNAFNIAKMARDVEENVNKQLKDMLLDANEADRLSKESEMLIKQAENISSNALEEADRLLTDAMKPLPDLGANQTKADAESVKKSSDDADSSSKKHLEDNEAAIEQLGKDDKEARELMEEGRQLKNDSNALYDRAWNASEMAKQAQEDGWNVAREAQKMLEDLRGFEEKIAKSKANATEALKLITLIKSLIKEANKTGQEADEKVSSAEGDAKMSFDIATKANQTTAQAKNDIEDVMKQARDLMNETMSFMMNELEETKNAINKTSEELDDYNQQAIDDGVAVEKARKESKNASSLATKVQNDLTNSLDNVEQLIVNIEALEDIDFATLEDAEKRFAEAKDTIDGAIASEIELLQNKLVEQNNTITRYELDLELIRKQINFVNELFLALPRGCFKAKPPEEEDRSLL